MRLENLIEALKRMPQDGQVHYDFCRRFPTGVQSYRGYYDQLALGHASYYDDNVKATEAPTVAALVKVLIGAIGKDFTGWKGGTFRMDASTEVWIDNPGEASSTAIDGVVSNGYGGTIIKTRNDDE